VGSTWIKIRIIKRVCYKRHQFANELEQDEIGNIFAKCKKRITAFFVCGIALDKYLRPFTCLLVSTSFVALSNI